MKDITDINGINAENIFIKDENNKLKPVGNECQFKRGTIDDNQETYYLIYNSDKQKQLTTILSTKHDNRDDIMNNDFDIIDDNKRDFEYYCQRSDGSSDDSKTVLVYDKIYLIKRRNNSTQ